MFSNGRGTRMLAIRKLVSFSVESFRHLCYCTFRKRMSSSVSSCSPILTTPTEFEGMIRVLILAVCMTGLVCFSWSTRAHLSRARHACRTQNCSSPRCLGCAFPQAALSNDNVSLEILNSTAHLKWTYADSLKNICRGSLAPVHYVIAVSSLPSAAYQRHIIRADLWHIRNASSSVKLIFFSGRPKNPALLARLKHERDSNADLVLSDLDGVPESASLATLVLLRWVAEFCSTAPFVIKITDEGRVNARFLQASYDLNVKLSEEFDMFGSFVSLRGEACSEPPTQHSVRRCPDRDGFLSGCAYMLTRRVVRPLLKASATHPPVLPEDVYVTGTLAEAIGARRGEMVSFEGCYYSYVKAMPFMPQSAHYWLRDRMRILLTKLTLFWQEMQ
ncbi:beta-1,3-galactosyltransferase 4-like isoform X2 [Dermacentor albipictus]|uniref:beta-1,3-galactosyltransferase 4-like isoform X2 n=1 Tax=Dermacentor albipictus TaxID=60249 RepID=UPI0038FD06DD